VARSFAQWGLQTALSLQDNLGEYLKYETNSVPARFEIDQFQREVDTLRDDVERLEARIQRITSTVPQAKAGQRKRVRGRANSEAD